MHAGRRQIEEVGGRSDGGHPGSNADTGMPAVLDDHHLAAVRIAAGPTHQATVLVCHCDDAHAAGTLDDCDVLAAAALDADIACAVAEAVGFIVTNDRATTFPYDDAVGLADDDAIALTFLAPLRA